MSGIIPSRLCKTSPVCFLGKEFWIYFFVMPPHLSCKICVNDWPLPDHFIGDLGLTKAYLFEDQFFPGWMVLIFKEHWTELFQLSREERARLMEEVSRAGQALARAFEIKKINYELLGNQVPHIHWHLIPRLKTDPDPLKPVWCVQHEPVRLPADQLTERVIRLRAALRIDPNQTV